jgi:uncharacterized protein with HEPN domain
LPQRDARKHLFDIAQEAAQLSGFVSGKSPEDYLGDRLLQRGVERQFEIIGEALSQMSKLDPHCQARFGLSKNHLIPKYLHPRIC